MTDLIGPFCRSGPATSAKACPHIISRKKKSIIIILFIFFFAKV